MKQKILRIIANLRFSIFILLLISFVSIIGTIIEQDQLIEVYKQNYPLTNPVFGFLTWDRILKFGLDHVYKTWWFLALNFLFGTSLISCTFLQQLPSIKIARRCQFFRIPGQFYKLKIFTSLNNSSFKQVLVKIQNNQYSIFQQKNIIYCYKGLIGRIAPILVHLSLILILIGTSIGSLFGFKGQEIIPKTESFNIQNLINVGQLSRIPQITIRINDFWITYTKNKTVSQFYADLSILTNQGNELKQRTISVNSPLVYKNLYYYQTDWNLIGLRFQIPQNEIIDYPLINLSNNLKKIWLTWISTNQPLNKGMIIIINNIEGYGSIYDETGKFLGNIELNETINSQIPINFLEILSSSGLQIKIDPGLPIIYSGFLFLMITTLMSYLTYSQIWILKKNQKLLIGGTTNRAFFDFELEFFKFIK